MLSNTLQRCRFVTNSNLVIKRCLTSTEVATALRPFYFAVHPDLFGQFPDQRNVNENSLKQLSSLLEKMQSKSVASPACNLKFYLRDKDKKDTFRLITLNLRERDIRDVVSKVLTTCGLSTDFIDKIPKPQPRPLDRTNDIDLTNIDPNNVVFGSISLKTRIREAQDEFRLAKWINDNFQGALDKSADNKAVREEVAKLKERLIDKLRLQGVKWECGWNETHFRGCLVSFNSLAEQHPENMFILRDRVLVFAPFTGVSLDGHVMLNSGEVRHNWLDLIKNIRTYDKHLVRIPAFERAVSQVLLNIKVGRRKFMPKILAGEYERNLSQLTTSLCDYLTYRKYPKSWPKTLEEYEIVVETEAGPMMVSPTGQFIVPASCPGFLLVGFITDNMTDAKERMENYKRVKYVERSLRKECISQLRLVDLKKDDNVNPDFMVKCCNNLLRNRAKLGNLTGVDLNIATYYSVLSDGVVCIPWNWTL